MCGFWCIADDGAVGDEEEGCANYELFFFFFFNDLEEIWAFVSVPENGRKQQIAFFQKYNTASEFLVKMYADNNFICF